MEPRTGDHFFREFSHLDGLCFEQYLSWFAQQYPDDLHLIQVDNSRCHTWLELELPDHVILIFQLPTQPEFNSGWKAAWSEERSDAVKMPSAPPYSRLC